MHRAAPHDAAPPISQRVSRRHQVRNQKQKVRCALVLLRHGQSRYNLEKVFTGWADPDLTSRGRDEARLAGQLLKGVGINKIEVLCTSLLQRAVRQRCMQVLTTAPFSPPGALHVTAAARREDSVARARRDGLAGYY